MNKVFLVNTINLFSQSVSSFWVTPTK